MAISAHVRRATIRVASQIAPMKVGSWAANIFLTTHRITRPEWENTLLKQAKKLSLSNGLSAWSWGQGPKVLLIHGWNGRGSQLSKFAEPLVNAGFEVIAWDGPAHGDSPGTKTNLGQFTKSILLTQNELGPMYAVIGHSFGAASAVLATHQGLDVERLVLIASPFSLQNIFDHFAVFMNLSPKAARAFQGYVEAEAGLKAADAQIHLVKIPQAKILLIHDRDDQQVSYKNAEKIASTWPSAQLMTTEGLGHTRILRAEEVVDRVRTFIQNQ